MPQRKDTKFNKSVAPLYRTKAGGFWMGSITLTREMLETLAEADVGGQLLVRINKFGKSEKSPHAYLDLVAPSDVSKFAERSKNNDEV